MKYITIVFLLISQFTFAQSKSLSKVVDKIDYQNDTIQAVYAWVTDNIKYDGAKLKKLEKGVNFYKKGNYKSTEEYKADLLEIVIKKKKGVCDDYSLLFDALVRELGYTSHIIEGITKNQNGKVNRNISHSWNAVKVNGTWKVYDATWGAGYLNDKKKFVKKFNTKWYGVDPEVMRKTHLPFDPIWQLAENPMTYEEFSKGNKANDSDSPYDYSGMIDEYLSKDAKAQKIDVLSRSKLNGGNIKAIKNYRTHLQNKISYYESNENSNLILNTLEANTEATELVNEYFKAKKNRFKSEKWTMEYAKNTLIEIDQQLEESIKIFKSITVKDSKSKRSIKGFISHANKLKGIVETEMEFLESIK